jgi:hypothetical protein
MTSVTASARIGFSNQPSTTRQPELSELPPRRSHVRQIANVVVPPVVSTQQSPHTGLRQRAHGPAATAPHEAQRASAGPSP